MVDVVIQGVTVFMTEGMEVATLAAFLAGILMKVWNGYRIAKKKDPTLTFDYDYLVTGLQTALIGLGGIIAAAPQVPTSFLSTVMFLGFIFGAGYGINEAVNRGTIDKAWEEGKLAPK